MSSDMTESAKSRIERVGGGGGGRDGGAKNCVLGASIKDLLLASFANFVCRQKKVGTKVLPFGQYCILQGALNNGCCGNNEACRKLFYPSAPEANADE